MARRLRVDGFDGSRPTAIPGIPAPVRGSGRAHSLAHVLEIALDQCGLALGYDAIMGLSGLAFRTPPWPGGPGLSADETRDAVEALEAALDGGPRLHSEADGLDEGAAMKLAGESIDAGRPCAALGWGSVKESWSIICGYDATRGRLLGHCLLDAPRKRYESWPPSLTWLVTFDGDPRPRGPAAIEGALRAGGRSWAESGQQRYLRWMASLGQMEQAAGYEHEAAVELLADSRAAAAGFLECLAELGEGIRASWLRRAAEIYRELIDLLEARGAAYSPGAAAALKDPAGRLAWAERLEGLASLDAEAARSLRLALTANYPPEDAHDA